MTTATIANHVSIQTAAGNIKDALRRLAHLARTDYTIDSAVQGLDALTAPDGPLTALREVLTGLSEYLAEFEHQDAFLAADQLDAAADYAEMTATRIIFAADHIRHLAQ